MLSLAMAAALAALRGGDRLGDSMTVDHLSEKAQRCCTIPLASEEEYVGLVHPPPAGHRPLAAVKRRLQGILHVPSSRGHFWGSHASLSTWRGLLHRFLEPCGDQSQGEEIEWAHEVVPR